MKKKTTTDPQHVSIATLKAHLAKYLRQAEAGEAIIVVDRHRPIARLMGLDHGRSDSLESIPPPASASELSQLKLNNVSALLPDIVELLIGDRRKR